MREIKVGKMVVVRPNCILHKQKGIVMEIQEDDVKVKFSDGQEYWIFRENVEELK